MLRDASELLYPAVMQAIAELGLLGSDAAAVKLAQNYAKAIDQASGAKRATVLRALGPELLKVLEALGATPQARAALTRGQKAAEPKATGLAALRAAK